MSVLVELDSATAIKVAEYFESAGMASAAARMWQYLCLASPYDLDAREKLGELLFDQLQSGYPRGSVARSHMILEVLGQSVPTEKLTKAYFDNLEHMLKTRVKRSTPGQVVLGVGPGRCGSTTLCAAIAALQDACATHENPSLIFWEPLESQIRFHWDRFRMLADYYDVVFDASHWWLNVLGSFYAEFPQGKVVGLHRNTSACVKSFVNIKGKGRGTLNHWAPPENNVWGTNLWDPTYPSYAINTELLPDPDLAKAALIERYVTDYNQSLQSLAETCRDRFLLLATEELNAPATATRLSSFLGASVHMPATALNVGDTSDSDKKMYRL